MSAERTPQAEPSFLARPLAGITRLVLRFPVATIALAVAAALVALALSGSRLGFRTSRLDLLNSECSYNRLWVDYIDEFGEEDDVVVVVEGDDREQVVGVLEELSTALGQEQRLFRAVLHGVDLSKIRRKVLYFLQWEQLLAIEHFLGKVDPMIHGDWARLRLGSMAEGMCARLESGDPQQAAAAAAEFARLSESLLAGIGHGGPYRSPWPEMPGLIATISELHDRYLLTPDGRLGFVLLRLAEDGEDSFVQGTQAIDALRRLIARVEAGHPEAKIGLTGLPVMENDEMRVS